MDFDVAHGGDEMAADDGDFHYKKSSKVGTPAI
jgi:hypothetical protein